MPRTSLIVASLLGSMALAFAATAQQTTVNLTANRDNSIFSESGNVSNGAGQFIFTGVTNNGDIRRALVRFDLTSIPAGASIDNATLTMTASRTADNAGRATTLHRVLADWGEGTSDASQGGEGQGAPATTNDATWTFRFFNTQSWATTGGDFNPTASATTTVTGNGTYTWNATGLLNDVRAWHAAPTTNFGWVARGVETTNATAKRFNSRTNGGGRPTLTVVYTPQTAPTGACCQSGLCTILSAAACASGGGTYQGDGAPCTPNPCPQPTGACCVAGNCTTQTAAACSGTGGTYQGDNSACVPNPCATTSITLNAQRDNTLYETVSGNQSNGAGMGFIVGTGGTVANRRRGVIAFNLTGIPANATIVSARLRLFLGFNGDTTTRTIDVHRVVASWGEGTSDAGGNETIGAPTTTNDATWLHRLFFSTFWATQGGDFNAAASASLAVGTTTQFFEWTGPGLAADVQGWLGTPATNFGWLLKNNDEAPINSQRRFESRTNPTVANRPQLIVTYTVPPPTGACCFPDGACTLLTSNDCAAQSGVYNGDSTVCSPNPCPQPTGACCLPSGNCVIATAAACSSQSGTYNGDNTTCASVTCPILLEPYVDALPIPPVAQPLTGQAGGSAHYEVAMTEFNQQLHRDLPPTRVWGYNGTFPGPTIEAFRDQPVTVTWVNDLRDLNTGQLRTAHYLPVDTCLHGPDVTGTTPYTVVHFHGGHVAPESDGNPDESFPPGLSSPLYHYPNDQRACTMWYHDHALGITRLNVYMGLAGAYLLRDGDENALGLPAGEYEIPLIIQDRSFNPDGSWQYHAEWHDHFFGKFALVNGKVWPFLNVNRGKYRFRVVNGSNTRFWTLALDNGATFQQIGSDQGLLAAPVTLSSLLLSPGERADIVIDFAPYAAGTQIVLTNSAAAPFPNGEPENELPNIMRFVVQAAAGDTDPLPASLVPVPPIPEAESVLTRTFTLRNRLDAKCNHDAWFINDLMWDDITDFPRLGTTEVWSLLNRSNLSHPIHIHLVSFQILDRQPITFVNDEPVPTGPPVPPPPDEAGWKDVVRANPFERTRVIMRFEGFAGLYPMHCHILEHEDHEMMRQFRVLCDAPAITGQPVAVGDGIGCTAQFDVVATGDELHYEWTRNGQPLSDGPTATGSVVSGSRTAILTIANMHAADEAAYACVVRNACGTQTSDPAALTTSLTLGDANCDCLVSVGDIAPFVLALTDPAAYPVQYPYCPITTCDVNQDGTVSVGDIGEFVALLVGG